MINQAKFQPEFEALSSLLLEKNAALGCFGENFAKVYLLIYAANKRYVRT